MSCPAEDSELPRSATRESSCRRLADTGQTETPQDILDGAIRGNQGFSPALTDRVDLNPVKYEIIPAKTFLNAPRDVPLGLTFSPRWLFVAEI